MPYTPTTWVDNTTPAIDAANLNNLETGVSNATTTADAAVPKSTVTATGDLIVATGNATVGRLGVGASTTVLHGGTTPAYSQIVNADVSATAAIAYSKLNLASSIVSADIVDGTIVNADINASAAIAISKLADPTTGKVVGSSGSAAAAVFPPGYEIAYVEFTSPVTANSAAETAAVQIVSSGTITYDGTAVLIEFFCPALVAGGSTSTIGVNLWDSTTDLGRLFDGTVVSTPAGNLPCYLARKLTPTAASHTYNIRIWSNSATNFIAEAGAGGAGTKLPGYIRVTKA